MRGVDLAPLARQRKDRVDLRRAQPVDRRARPAIVKQPRQRARLSVTRAALPELQQPTRPAKAPAALHGLLDQPQQRALDVGVHARRDVAYQPKRDFPRNATSSIACSLTVSSNRAISARGAPSSTSRRSPSRRPGRDCANAVSAPSRPTRRIRITVVASTPNAPPPDAGTARQSTTADRSDASPARRASASAADGAWHPVLET